MTQANIKSNNSLIPQLKAENQDFEFYPTTAAIAEAIYKHLDSHSSILDIGAGNGNFFRLLENIDSMHTVKKDEYGTAFRSRIGEKYAIEKSKILIDNMDKDISLIGTDFYKQTLLDKKVNVIFSNPPYSDAERWTVKIINESNCKHAFVVIPLKKWDKSNLIKGAIEGRRAEANKIFEFDFMDSEFRQARTKAGVYKISFCRHKDLNVDPFDLWFNEHFKFSTCKDVQPDEAAEAKNKQIVDGRNLIERLETIYNQTLEDTQRHYHAISSIPFELLEELNISKNSVKSALKMKLQNTKYKFWTELFNNLEVITKKLTVQKRKDIQEKLNSSTNVDFSAENAYAVVCWVLKNANSYFSEQLLNVYKNITGEKNVQPYKSNHRFKTDDFRFCSHNEEYPGRYKLDYRIILDCYIQHNYNGEYYWIDEYPYEALRNRLSDIFVIANNLGFEIPSPLKAFSGGDFGDKITIYDKDCKVFAEVRVYKKGTIHFKFCKEFMKAFNIEAGRLLGWLKTPQQAATELELKPEECLKYFKSNISLDNSNIKLLAG